MMKAIQMPTALNRCPFTSWPRPGKKKENKAGIPCVLQQFIELTFFKILNKRRGINNLTSKGHSPLKQPPLKRIF